MTSLPRRFATTKKGLEDVFAKLEEKKRVAIPKIEVDLGTEKCPICKIALTRGDAGYVCGDCGYLGVKASELHVQMDDNRAVNLGASNGECETLHGSHNATYKAVFTKLEKFNRKSPYPIPAEILRQVAREYAEISQKIKDDQSAESGKRLTTVLPALLQQVLDRERMSKTDSFICGFMGIPKNKLTRAKNKIERCSMLGHFKYAPQQQSTIESYAYQFLVRLDMNAAHTAFIVDLIGLADKEEEMVDYSSCHTNTKVTGAIWMLNMHMDYGISHKDIYDRHGNISKSTYVRYKDYLVKNRRPLNPTLVRHGFPPIPRKVTNRTRARNRRANPPPLTRAEQLTQLAQLAQ